MKRLYLQKSCIEKQYVHIRNSLIAVSMACLSTSMMPCYAQEANPNSSFLVTPADPADWNNLNLPHRLTLEGKFESPDESGGKIEYAVEDSEEWTALTENMDSGSKFSSTITVNFVPGKAKHNIRLRVIDYSGTITLLAPIEYTDISACEFTGIKDYTFTGDSIYQQEISSSLSKKQYVVTNYQNNVNAGKANFLIEGVFPYTIGSKNYEFTIYQMDAQEWKLLTVLNATLIKMGWKEPWDMSQGEKSASQLKGVTLEKGHVKALDLSNQQLAGNLPATAFVLPKLESLNISHNRFKGNLGVLGRTLPALTTLDASYNGFTDVLPTLPAAIKQLNISNQTIDKTITVDGSHFNINAIIPQLPTILAYDHEKQGYNTSEIGFLITQSDSDYWYSKWGMHVIYKNGKLSVPYITTPFEYRGESGDTLTAVKLNNDWGQSIEGSNLKLKYIFQQGDANFAPGIDATDLQTTILYAFGEYNYKPFNFTAADTYKDEIINVQDVVCTVNIILDKAASTARNYYASRSYDENADAENLQDTEFAAQAGIYLRDGKIFLNTEVPVAAISIAASGHINWNLKQLGMEQATEGSSLVSYSLSGNTLPIGETLIGTYDGDATITGISLADEEAKSISSGTHNGTVTRINGISESNDAAEMGIFNTQGIRTQKMQKGINIVKTQKGTRKVVKK